MGDAISHDQLEFQSDRIERVLAAHRVPVAVHGGLVTPRWIRFHFTPTLGARLTTIRHLSEELALALGVTDVRVAREGEMLTLEVPRPDPRPVRLLPLWRGLPALPPYTACLGLAEDGRPLLIRLASPDVTHILIAGATGSGKTELLRALLLSLALRQRPAQLQWVLIDPKGRGLAPLAEWPHGLTAPLTQPDQIMAWLTRLVAEMERRDRERVTQPRLVIAIDELADLLTTLGAPAEQALTRLAQRGREAGLHLIVGTQKPSAAVLGPLLKANFPARLAGRVGSAEDARVATGQGASGAERLLGRGDFLAVAAGRVTRFQAAWLTPEDWLEASALARR